MTGRIFGRTAEIRKSAHADGPATIRGMEPRPDVVVVVPESLLQWAEPLRYACLGFALLLVLTVVVLVVRKRLRAKAG